MILYFETEQEAIVRAAQIHADLYAERGEYAASVDEGQTVRWAIPAQEENGTRWGFPVDSRCVSVLTDAEREALGP